MTCKQNLSQLSNFIKSSNKKHSYCCVFIFLLITALREKPSPSMIDGSLLSNNFTKGGKKLKSLKTFLTAFSTLVLLTGVATAILYGGDLIFKFVSKTVGELGVNCLGIIIVIMSIAFIGWLLSSLDSNPFEETFLPKVSYLEYLLSTFIAFAILGALALPLWAINTFVKNQILQPILAIITLIAWISGLITINSSLNRKEN